MADETGGRYVKAEWDSSLGETFQRILREYRQRYILTFTPEGVQTGDGWHALEVKVKRGGALVAPARDTGPGGRGSCRLSIAD